MSAPVRAMLVRGGILTAILASLAVTAWMLVRNPVDQISLSGVDRNPEPRRSTVTAPQVPPRRHEGFVGGQVCAECHQGISERYKSHPMAQSMAAVSDVLPIEDYVESTGFAAPPSTLVDLRVRYYVERGDDGAYHHEQALLPGGEVLYDQRVPVHYAVGSGARGRSYLTNRGGLLYMSPISWYSGQNRWDLSPGYQKNNRHFERRILDGCVTCHAGRMNPIAGRPNCYQPANPFLETAIGCERCHGPGEEHVAIRRNMQGEPASDPIINPARLEPTRRDAVCFQCHLTGETRIPRYGHNDFDFRPGDELIDVWTVFVKGTGVAADRTTESVNQVEQMISSACFRRSNGRLGCISCHDPHSVPTAGERVRSYRARCLECHAADGSGCSLPVEDRLATAAGDSCIDCHMPRITANDVPHTAQTDHRVLRRYEADGGIASVAADELRIFGDESGRLPAAERDRALGLMMAGDAEQAQDNYLLAAKAIDKLKSWVAAVPDDQRAAEMLGAAYRLSDYSDTARRIWLRTLESDPDNEDVLKRLLETCEENGRRDEALEYSRRLTELNPWVSRYHARLARALGQVGQYDAAIDAGKRAVELNPSDYWIRGSLAEVYRRAGHPELARPQEVAHDFLAPGPRP